MRHRNIELNWRVRPIPQPRVLKGHDDHVITCLQFCNNRVVSGSDDNTLKVWSATTGKVRFKYFCGIILFFNSQYLHHLFCYVLCTVPEDSGRTYGRCLVFPDARKCYREWEYRSDAQSVECWVGPVSAYSLWTHFHCALHAFTRKQVSVDKSPF